MAREVLKSQNRTKNNPEDCGVMEDVGRRKSFKKEVVVLAAECCCVVQEDKE